MLGLLISAALAAEGAAATIYERDVATAPNAAERPLLDLAFGRGGADRKLRAALAARPSDKDFQTRGWRALCTESYQRGRYAQAVQDCKAAMAASPADKVHGKDTLAVVEPLAGTPAPKAVGKGGRVAIGSDGRIPVMTAGGPIGAIPDTGAQISVMMQSVADRANVRILGASGDVGTTTSTIQGKIGVIPHIEIAGARLENLPVLVLPDEALTFEGGKFKIEFVLGVYPLRAFGRIAWLENGKWLALGEGAPAPTEEAVPVTLHDLGFGLPLDGPGGRLEAHFDSGSNTTYLYESALPILAAGERAAMVEDERKIGGLGGVTTEKIKRLPKASLSLAGAPLVLERAVVAKTPESGDAARIGVDIASRYRTVVLDFDTMRFSVTP